MTALDLLRCHLYVSRPKDGHDFSLASIYANVYNNVHGCGDDSRGPARP